MKIPEMVAGKLMRLLLAWGALVASQVLSEKTNEETLLEEKNTDRDTLGVEGLWPRMSSKPGSRWQRLLLESKTKEDGNTLDSTDEHESKWDKLDKDEKTESTIIKWGKNKTLKEDSAKDGYTNQKKAYNNMQEYQKKNLNTFETDRDIDDDKDGHMYPDSTWKDKQYLPQSKANKANKESETVEQKINRKGSKVTMKNSEKYEDKPGNKLRDWLKLKTEKENKQNKVGESMQLTKGHKTHLKEEEHQRERKWHWPDKHDGKHGTKEDKHVSIVKNIGEKLGEKAHGLTHHNGKHGSTHHNGKHGSKHHIGEHRSKHHNGDHGSKPHNGGHEYIDPLLKLKIQHKKRWPTAIRLR